MPMMRVSVARMRVRVVIPEETANAVPALDHDVIAVPDRLNPSAAGAQPSPLPLLYLDLDAVAAVEDPGPQSGVLGDLDLERVALDEVIEEVFKPAVMSGEVRVPARRWGRARPGRGTGR
jgi:hypothetical protein